MLKPKGRDANGIDDLTVEPTPENSSQSIFSDIPFKLKASIFYCNSYHHVLVMQAPFEGLFKEKLHLR